MMKTINLPEGNAFGVDDDDSDTPIVDYAEHRAKTLFFVWGTLTEHKRVIFGERRGSDRLPWAPLRETASPRIGVDTPFAGACGA